jgi:glycosyltransferase involved in cell wall biosynthesis
MCLGKLLSPYVVKFYGVTPLRCDFLKEVYRIDKSKVELLVMGIDDDLLLKKDLSLVRSDFRNQLNLTNNDFLIVTGGKIDQKKNIHHVLQAISNLNLENVKLVVFGVIAPEIKDIFETLLLDKNISFIGWLNPDQIINLFLSADLIVFPGTHSVLWEQAVGIGVPCVFKFWEGMNHVDMGGNCRFLYQDTVLELEQLLPQIILTSDYFQMKKISSQMSENFYYSEISRKAIL